MKHIGSLSGGADSQAVALWLRLRFPPDEIILLNSTAGRNEHILTTEFIQAYSASVFPVVSVDALISDLGGIGTRDGLTKQRREEHAETDLLTFDKLAYIKNRFPSRKAQFCTEYLKLRPMQRWIKENLGDRGIEYTMYCGVRRDESVKRSTATDCDYDTFFGCTTHRPIAAWTKQEVFDFLAAHGETVNPLYRMGFSRVGCAPCVNANKSDIREWAARFPEVIDKVRAWEQSVGRTFFYPMVPGKEINWIDEVVTWSRTAHGGKQGLLMFVEEEAKAGGCVSSWGLCE